MWLLRRGVHASHFDDVLELVEDDGSPEAAVRLEPKRQVEQCVQSRQRVVTRIEL